MLLLSFLIVSKIEIRLIGIFKCPVYGPLNTSPLLLGWTKTVNQFDPICTRLPRTIQRVSTLQKMLVEVPAIDQRISRVEHNLDKVDASVHEVEHATRHLIQTHCQSRRTAMQNAKLLTKR